MSFEHRFASLAAAGFFPFDTLRVRMTGAWGTGNGRVATAIRPSVSVRLGGFG